MRTQSACENISHTEFTIEPVSEVIKKEAKKSNPVIAVKKENRQSIPAMAVYDQFREKIKNKVQNKSNLTDQL